MGCVLYNAPSPTISVLHIGRISLLIYIFAPKINFNGSGFERTGSVHLCHFQGFFLLVLDGDLAVDAVVTWTSDGFLVVVGGVSCWCGGFVAVVAVGWSFVVVIMVGWSFVVISRSCGGSG